MTVTLTHVLHVLFVGAWFKMPRVATYPTAFTLRISAVVALVTKNSTVRNVIPNENVHQPVHDMLLTSDLIVRKAFVIQFSLERPALVTVAATHVDELEDIMRFVLWSRHSNLSSCSATGTLWVWRLSSFVSLHAIHPMYIARLSAH